MLKASTLFAEHELKTSSILKNSLSLISNLNCRVFAAHKDMKVASQDIEKLFGEARKAGVVFFRYDEVPPIIIKEDDAMKLADMIMDKCSYAAKKKRGVN